MTATIPEHNNMLQFLCLCGIVIIFLYLVQWPDRVEKRYRQKIYGTFLTNNPNLSNIQFNNDTVAETSYYVRSEHCKMPSVNPFSSDIIKKYKPWSIQNCSSVDRLVETIFDANLKRYYLHIRKDVGPTLSNYSGDISCCYKQIIRKTVDDDKIIMKPCRKFQQNFLVPLYIEGMIVECYSANCTKLLQKDGFTFIQMKNLTKVPKKPFRKPSVLLLGIDSLSRINFRRTMLKTYGYIKRSGWYEMQGYNKMGDNTFPNLMAIMAGYELKTAYNTCMTKKSGGLNACPLIWKNFRNQGYRTAYAEDESDISTFNYLKDGFSNPPTDYYLRPYIMAFERYLVKKKRCGLTNCLGMRHAAQYVYDFAIQLSNRYNDEPVFGLFWINSFSHNCYGMPSAMDHVIYGYMLDLEKLNILETSIVVFLSDHGMRFGTLNHLPSGFLEERLPMLFIWLPQWFKQQHPQVVQALKVNRNRLTSPYDLHMTLKHLVAMAGGKENVKLEPAHDCPKCQSLFHEIPENRYCDEAGIPDHWCTCIPYQEMVKNGKSCKMASLVVDKMNRYLTVRNFSDVCSKLTLRSVDNVFRRMILEDEPPVNMYRINLKTNPNKAKFQCTFIYHGNNDTVTLDVESISRVNSYELDSKCVKDKQAKKYCICRNAVVSNKRKARTKG